MEKLSEEIVVCNLEVVVMPTGEIFCLDKTVGWFGEFKKYLTIKDESVHKESVIDVIDPRY